MPLVSRKGTVTLVVLLVGVCLIAALALLKPKAERAPLKATPAAARGSASGKALCHKNDCD